MVAAARHLHHLPAQETVLDEGWGEALVGAPIPQLAVTIVAPAVQLTRLRVGWSKLTILRKICGKTFNSEAVLEMHKIEHNS